MTFVKPQVHMVGSVPTSFATTERAALCGVAKKLDPYLLARTGGDVRRSRTWILDITEATKKWLNADQAKKGAQIKEYHELEFAKLHGPMPELDESLLPFAVETDRVFEAVQALQADSRLRKLPVQVNITHWADHAAFTLGDEALGRTDVRVAFKQLHVAAIRKIHEKYGDRVVFQIETPYSLLQVANAAPEDRERVAKKMAAYIHSVVELAPRGAKFIVHLCRGDLDHKSWPTADDSLQSVVTLANAVVDSWSSHHELVFVHLPLRKAQDRPSLDESYYGPLADLSDNGRFAAGIISECVDDIHNVGALVLAAKVYHGDAPPGERIFVAAGGPCGGGRMTFQGFVDWLHQHQRVMLAMAPS